MALDFDQFNSDVQQWGAETRQLIQTQGKAQGVLHRPTSPSAGDSLARVRDSYRQASGVVSRVSFKFPRTLIYTMKGAGRGKGGQTGSRWTNARGQVVRTRPESLGKQGTGNRHAKPFLNDALNSPAGIDRLADIAATNLADVVVKNILVK